MPTRLKTFITHIINQLQPVITQPEICHQYAWWLIEHAKGKKRDILLQENSTLCDHETAVINQWITDICMHHKPIAYILGTVPFGPLMLNIRPPILIPRPETEEWVLALIDQIKQKQICNLTILDMCTGSGCIALLCAKLLPQATIYAIDISDNALQLANENKQQLHLKNVTFIHSDLFKQLKGMKFDLILSNPPYIGADEQLDISVTTWEDPQALYADNNGYAIIQQIIRKAPEFLQPHTKLQQHHINQLYIEIGWQQKTSVIKLMQNAGYAAITSKKDLAGKDRVVSGSFTYAQNKKS